MLLSSLFTIPLACASFAFFHTVKWLLHRLRRGRDRKQDVLKWHTISEVLARPLALPYIMVTGPRWNPHALISRVGPFQVERGLQIKVDTARQSAQTWTLIINRAADLHPSMVIDASDVPQDEVWYEQSLASGRYLAVLRYYEWSATPRLPAIGLLQAKTAVLEREIDLVAGENASEDVQARLKALLNLDRVAAPAEYTLVPTDAPRIEPITVSIEEGLKSALAKRPEFFQARLDQENRVLGERYARNQQMPELNFIGSIGLSGLSGSPTANLFTATTVGGVPVSNFLPDGQGTSTFDGGYGTALGKLVSGDFMSYKVRLSVQIPLGNQLARSEVAKSRLEVEKSKMFFQSLEQKIALEIERVARGITNSLRAVEGARALRNLTEHKLAMAREGLELGAASVTDVIEAQKNLHLAERDELRAIIEYEKTTALWEKSTGIVLERFHIEL
jgi:hypothetical protein